MVQPPRLHLFQAYGIELEYMIIDRDTLDVRPITDELLKHEIGSYGSDFENGNVTWSNELVLHVVELKSTNPESNLNALEHALADNVRRINNILAPWNATLLPSAAHPFMDPMSDTRLWPHENNEVYSIYNKIFDCRGHGWSNLQSTHLNLPFYDDEEFAKLHAAVRMLLPILPALCASSPILDGKFTGQLNTRLKYYKQNQSKLPSITGRVIPEAVFSKRNYLNTVYEKIKSEISPYDPENVLNPIWVNSRGAIPRFDRGSIEIRIMDIQECPAADIAIVSLVIESLKCLVKGSLMDFDTQLRWKTEPLVQILDQTIDHAEKSVIDDREYLAAFGLDRPSATAGELWSHIQGKVIDTGNKLLEQWKKELDIILTQGTLGTRLLKALGPNPAKADIVGLYKRLSGCLAQNKMFLD
ncbi:MAG TPA: glutamate-cysteine ligase family protein [Chryseosolibacter sp.]|nr:glutamate-cysteine ligase family protein [Chryseosolibacter sp.]